MGMINGPIAIITTLAEVKALTSRPTQIRLTGSGGGVFVWYPGDSTTANDATVIQCTSGPSGRYKRFYSGSINPRWFGCVMDGVTDDTSAFQLALNVGGDILIDGSMVLSSVTCTVARTRLRGLNGAKIIAKTGSIGFVIKAWADYFVVENLVFEALDSPGLQSHLWVAGNYCRMRDLVLIGQIPNPMTPNVQSGPYYGLYVGPNGPVAMYTDNVISRVQISGGNHGIVVYGGRRMQVSNISISNTFQFGMIVGNGMTPQEFQISNFQAISCGSYGFSNSNPSQYAAIDPVPMSGWTLTNMHTENCGWRTYFSGIGGAVGSAKYGYDITDSGLNGLRFQGSALNCAAGGLESKVPSHPNYDTSINTASSTTSGNVLTFSSGATSGIVVNQTVTGHANIPSDTYVASFTSTTVTLTRNVTGTVPSGSTITFSSNVQPFGHRHAIFDFSYVSHLDFGQSGMGIYQEDATIPASTNLNLQVKCHAVTEQAPSWRSFLLRKPFDICASNGLAWMCMGDVAAGVAGITGQTAPPAGGNHVLATTNAITSINGLVLNFSGSGSGSTANIQDGMYVFGIGIQDGTTVASHTSTTVTLTTGKGVTSQIASGASIVFATVVSDGNMNWLCMKTDTSGASTTNTGLNITGTKNLTADVDFIGFSRGVYVNTSNGSDNIVEGFKCTARVRGASWGIMVVGVGTLTNSSFVDCDVEASNVSFYHSPTGGTHDFSIIGGRYKSIGNGYCFRVDSGINTIRLDGGAYFWSVVGRSGLVNGGTNTIRCGAATFEIPSFGAPVVTFAAGSGTWDWGNAIIYQGSTSNPGYQITGGTMTCRGRVLRQDIITAPINTKRASPGEYMVLASPTSTERGYHCQIADFSTPLFTWKKLAIV